MVKTRTVHKKRRPLLDVLRQAKRPLRPEELFRKAGFPPEAVEEFYVELRAATSAADVTQETDDNGNVFLKA